MIKQRLKVVAVAGVVVLALTGFSRHGGHGHSSGGGGGGGCSGPSHTSGSGTSNRTGGTYDSGTDMDTDTDSGSAYGGSSSGSYGDDGGQSSSAQGSRYGYSNGPTHDSTDPASDGGDSTATATAKTLSCASPASGARKAVTSSKVQVSASNANGGTARFDIDVIFRGSASDTVDTGTTAVSLKPGQTKTVTVPMNAPSQVSRVASCVASVL